MKSCLSSFVQYMSIELCLMRPFRAVTFVHILYYSLWQYFEQNYHRLGVAWRWVAAPHLGRLGTIELLISMFHFRGFF